MHNDTYTRYIYNVYVCTCTCAMYVCGVYHRGEDNALLVWSSEVNLDQPLVYPFPKQTQHGSGYLLPLLTQSVSSTHCIAVIYNVHIGCTLTYSVWFIFSTKTVSASQAFFLVCN